MTIDIPNAYIQTSMPKVKDGEDRIVMKVQGVLVDWLVEVEPDYAIFVVFKNGTKTLYLVVLKAIYGMLIASMLWYKKLKGDLEGMGFHFNSYDPCVANREKGGSQHTIRFHVDDIMSSHKDEKVNDEFYLQINDKYGELKEVTVH